jgi:ubiquinol-cytochrome c reductase cytochrome c1 subunit
MFRLNRLNIQTAAAIAARTKSTAATTTTTTAATKKNAAIVAGITAGSLGLAFGSMGFVYASSDVLNPPHYPWSHKGRLSSFDHAAIRRGFQGELIIILYLHKTI